MKKISSEKKNLVPGLLEEKLSSRGIGIKELTETAMSMYIYDPKIGKSEKVRAIARKEFRKILSDINICCLVMAGLYLEESGTNGLIPGISLKKYDSDPVDLIADEILGQSIAIYIAGTRALFEFERIDKKKPGILKTLPPFLDDIIAGLISGVMVKICSK